MLKRVSHLSPKKRAQLVKMLNETGTNLSSQQTIPKKKHKDQSRLSFAQQRLWFLNQFEPDSVAYNMPLSLLITGELNISALEQSIGEIIKRHEILRTVFPTEEGNPFQRVKPPKAFILPQSDLSTLPDAQQEKEVKQRLYAEATKPFNLATGPLIRGSLLLLKPFEYLFLITMHHIVSDGWSMGVLYRELSSLYETFSQGNSSPLPDLPIQYADFAAWQRDWLQGKVLEKQLSYWRKQLGGELSILKLPTDSARPSEPTHKGGLFSLMLPEELSSALKALCEKERVTLFMATLAVFKILLHRLTSQDDVIIGSPIANRNRQECENLIGFFVNTLVLRTNLSGSPTFHELLKRVRSVTLDAYTHQDIPFEKLVEELQPDRNLSHTPFFQVMLNMVNLGQNSIELSGMKTKILHQREVQSKFDLTLYVHPEDRTIQLDLVYNKTLFKRSRMQEMLHQVRYLFEQVVEKPDKPIDKYSLRTTQSAHLLPDPEQILPDREFPLVISMFLEHAKQSPAKPAVSQGSQVWTYRQLADSTIKLAHTLNDCGVKKGETVAVTGPKCFGVISAAASVFWSGGVLLLIDDNIPVTRKKVMCKEAKVNFLIQIGSFEKSKNWFQKLDLQQIITVEPDSGDVVKKITMDKTSQRDLPELTAEDTAYIVFTSGTTGGPKGVLGSHKGLSHFLIWQRDTFAVGPKDRCAQLTGISFDVVFRDIFLPLISGATLCLPEDPESLVTSSVLQWLKNERVTLLHVVPSVVRSWLDSVPPEITLQALRVVFFAGEPLREALLHKWNNTFPNSGKIVNLYGPTETTLAKCYYTLPPDNINGVQPIGRPLPDSQAHIISKNGQLCGIGEIGEIVLRTPFNLLGYFNSPKDNKSHFVKNPFRDDPNDTMYFTGDLGRYRSDGVLEILGRLDDQVKIRGVRIEPEEVITALESHDQVESAFVIASKDHKGEYMLAAYIVPLKHAEVSISRLRSYVKKQLPEYMIPSVFIVMDSLPLTPNGKVDRRALPDPTQKRFDIEDTFVGPRTPVEELLADIWREVLGLAQVGIHDNFFELGGHSLMATQVISRVRVVFEMEISLQSFFEAPSVAGLSKIFSQYSDQKNQPAAPIIALSKEKDSPLSFAQQRLWFLDQLEPDSSTYNISVAIRLTGKLNVTVLSQSLNEIVRRHDVLRTIFISEHGQPLQRTSSNAKFILYKEDLSTLLDEQQREAKVKHLAKEDFSTPFNLAVGPLLRATLIRLADEKHILLLTVHHIISDGWSMGILYRELSVLYESFSLGKETPLLELPIQYTDFVTWQRQWLQGIRLEEQLAYWKNQLQDLTTLELPLDHPRPAVQTSSCAVYKIQFPSDLLARLQKQSRREGVTLFMTLLAAFQVLLCRYTGQHDIVIGTPIANRNRTEIESLIGFFVNTLVVRVNTSGNPVFKKFLKNVQKILLNAFNNQDLPFEKLVEELRPNRDLSRNPLFQVMFVLQNAPLPSLKFPGVKVSEVEVEKTSSKFDLQISMEEKKEGLCGHFIFNSDLFDAETIERMAGHYNNILETIAENPSQRLSEIPLLTKAEQYQMLVEWNDTDAELPKETCIHQLFEEQAARRPDSVSVFFEHHRLTYRELNARANKLASYLRTRGVKRESLVGIHMERSLDMVIGLLAIMKAGGVFLPLDPLFPPERLAFMLQDAKPTVVLTQIKIKEFLPGSDSSVICFEDYEAMDIEDDSLSIDNGLKPSNLAYILYTSGSTGNPKGVQICHHSVVNFLSAMQKHLDVSENDILVAVTTLSFDISILELFLPLTVGSCVVITSAEVAANGERLSELISETEATIMQATPATWHLLLQNGWKAEQPFKILCGGEALQSNLADQLVSQNTTVWNLYGPTETTIWSAIFQVQKDLKISIGRPLANTYFYILDSHMQIVPVGVSGELFIGGVGLAKGYLNRPELTAEKFIPNPFSNDQEARLYKTGDFARYLPNGNIEFIGRIDHQVKIRGFRIELGEIETILGMHPGVRETVVIVREDNPGDKRLVAYLVFQKASPVATNELMRFLKKKLPGYMIPSAFVVLETLPLTPNGKVNRRALPSPDCKRPDLASAFVGPRNTTEKLLADIWKEILGLSRVGSYDNFFDLGGHSLLATQIASRIENCFNLRIPLRIVFEKPTIAEQAEYIENEFNEIHNTEPSSKSPVNGREDFII